MDAPKQAAVLGAGIMGGGIAYQSALKGVPVIMKDISDKSLTLGMSEAAKLLNKQLERGKLDGLKMAQVLSTIQPTLDYAGIERAQVIVEAVVENPKVKAAVLSEVENLIGEDTVLASNTSTIPINHLAKSLKRPQNFCGMHFLTRYTACRWLKSSAANRPAMTPSPKWWPTPAAWAKRRSW